MENDLILKVRNLKKYFPIQKGILKRTVGYVKAVDGISFDVPRGKTLGIVGESGCGKTTTGKCILKLYETTGGEIVYYSDNREKLNITKLDPNQTHEIRREIQMILQDPHSSLNPKMSVKSLLEEPMKIFSTFDKGERKEKVIELLDSVGMNPEYMERYPNEMSGGQKQRIGIARALSLEPDLIVCDEPVSALDVSIQAQVLELMKRLQREYNLSYIFIGHDIAVVEYMSDAIAVMYLGKIVEIAETNELLEDPLHPYTKKLLAAVPRLGKKRERVLIKGQVGDPANPPDGCYFHPRCESKKSICTETFPGLREIDDKKKHKVACHLYQ